jgi:hypothetical protein
MTINISCGQVVNEFGTRKQRRTYENSIKMDCPHHRTIRECLFHFTRRSGKTDVARAFRSNTVCVYSYAYPCNRWICNGMVSSFAGRTTLGAGRNSHADISPDTTRCVDRLCIRNTFYTDWHSFHDVSAIPQSGR